MQLEDWLDDLCVRFIINLPPEELQSVERICFQVEEAQWFYEDFIRPLDPSLPSLSLRAFSLRIFQHCPLFSQWSAQYHTTAFAEFLAYKSRVPVRGAIMLNDAMDEVVLVKGWKKSANWSFPRGKINKDENDLDCAVREVYEETGFDIRAAGLVKDEKDMKYIEVTMREQHMRLYVFRGVPRDTQFEPKTRKEISKIEWYKLTDLPTLKKSRQHEGSGTDQPTFNANKFYMVAPFLNPLKKWIAQQRKKDNRYSSYLAAPPMVPEEVAPEDDQDINGVDGVLTESAPQEALSDLPEVSAPPVDPTTHLKEILNIGSSQSLQPELGRRPSHMHQVDTEKSNALLALLRSNSKPQTAAIPRTPLEQISSQPEVGRSPQVSHVNPPQLDQAQPWPLFQPRSQFQVQRPVQSGKTESPTTSPPTNYPQPMSQQIAPYQQTGDPQFAQQGTRLQHQPTVPPASALPKLTNHTRALLDVFKSAGTNPSVPSYPLSSKGPSNDSSEVEALHRPERQQQNVSTQASTVPNLANQEQLRATAGSTSTVAIQPTASEQVHSHLSTTTPIRTPANAQQSTLLDLLSRTSKPKPTDALAPPQTPLVELAATGPAASTKKPQTDKDELLLALLRQGSPEASRKTAEAKRPPPREGETSATVSGPLNQPEFEAISRNTTQMTNEMGRSPLTSNRTLYDPNQPTPVKILTRSEESRQQAPRSPRGLKVPPKRTSKEKSTAKEQSKIFQPQILRRPQTAETSEAPPQPTVSETTNHQAVLGSAVSSPPASVEASARPIPVRQPSQTEAHKQRLLSLFAGGLDSTPRASTLQATSGVVSPLTTSQLFSPNGEGPLSGIEPISTRTSRGGSLASIGSGPGPARTANEKRQTGAENKAFLLGYLGRIASQEG
ncbi:uncharacterized protein Z518_02946 [Rhinocladiella mackenziei CBS 650.93]|uniref:Nudix hydrolase domain-containing protein n=1 Tax=Rhinocladiella mackenziei CBS 650.93 TaxID=1442369 RepID=A0A0D2JG30_9EURO|nr:uncharacterized protein Z518_02946 [Rhinocladiella mackenziei CBS 650.93]KIX08290.1 hypothetical protein Z518_02946 [Rhinocladiella mackenziei CBS 650.93]